MPSDFAQTVKAQTDIVKVIGEYVRLRKAGAQNWTGLCPFHAEKSPSFSVHAVRQFFHCFGCGVSGDVFSFLQKIENLPFPEAVKLAAAKSGIPLPKREFASPEEAAVHRARGRLLELHELATDWFQQQLQTPEGAGARAYLSSRGLQAEGIGKFRIGYAPESYHALREHLSPRATPDELRLSGLFSWKENEDGTPSQLYSRFRKRITFPIANEGGRVIAFTARALEAGGSSSSDKAGPKYLNSPETPLYSKGQVLFNLDRARQAIRQLDFALLVEGQMDCISVALAGIGNVVATSGTAFTETQARLLGRYTRKVIVNFDPDTAGATAAEKSIALLTEEGFEVRVVTLPDGLDPDRFVRERGLGAYTASLRAARRHTDYLLDRARQLHPPVSAEAKLHALNYLLPHIRRIPSRLARDEFAMEAAHRLSIDSALIREELKQAASQRRSELSQTAVAPKLSDAERDLVRALAGSPLSEAFGHTADALDAHPEYFESLTAARLIERLRHRGDAEPLAALDDEQDRAMLASALLSEHASPTVADVQAALESLRHAALARELRALRLAITEAERQGDHARTLELTRRKQALDQTLRALS